MTEMMDDSKEGVFALTEPASGAGPGPSRGPPGPPVRSSLEGVSRVVVKLNSYFNGDAVLLESLPNFDAEAILTKAGLLAGPLIGRHRSESHPSAEMHQRLVLLLLGFMMIKWVVCFMLPLPAEVDVFLGDFSRYASGGRLVIMTPIVCMSIQSFFVARYFTRERKRESLDRFDWLIPFQVLKRKKTHVDLNIEKHEAVKLWLRARWFWNFGRILLASGMVTIGIVYYAAYFRSGWYTENVPRYGSGIMIGLALLHSAIGLVWAYYTLTIQIGCVGIFYLTAYYLATRFKRIVFDTASYPRLLQEMNSHRKFDFLTKILEDHNEACRLTTVYDSFWSPVMTSIWTCYPGIMCFVVYHFLWNPSLNYFVRLALMLIGCYAGLLLTLAAISASWVSYRAHFPYVTWNSLAIKSMPILLKQQLQQAISRLDSQIGFTCSEVFPITFPNFSNILLGLATYLLLVADFTQEFDRVI